MEVLGAEEGRWTTHLLGCRYPSWLIPDVYYISIVARIAALIEGLEPAGGQLHLWSHFGCC